MSVPRMTSEFICWRHQRSNTPFHYPPPLGLHMRNRLFLWLRSFSFITARDLFICTCFYGILIEGSFLSGQRLSQHRIQKETKSLVYFVISLILYKMSPLYLVVISAFVTRIWGSFSGLRHNLLFGLPSVCAPTISYLYSFVKQIW